MQREEVWSDFVAVAVAPKFFYFVPSQIFHKSHKLNAMVKPYYSIMLEFSELFRTMHCFTNVWKGRLHG